MSARVMPSRIAVAAKTVLVADDTAFVRDRFRVALQSSGHLVTAVSTGSELLFRARQKEPIDLVVLDLRLPQAQGVAIVRALRRIEGFRAPIVIFSGTIANAEEVRELGALGVSGYINEYSAVQHIVPALASHLFPDADNRRSSPRVALGVSVSYRVGNLIAAAVQRHLDRSALGDGFAVYEDHIPRADRPWRLRAHQFLLESKSISAGSVAIDPGATEPGLRTRVVHA